MQDFTEQDFEDSDAPYTEEEVIQALKDLGRAATEEEIAMAIEVGRRLKSLTESGHIKRTVVNGEEYYEAVREETKSACHRCPDTTKCGTDACIVTRWAFER